MADGSSDVICIRCGNRAYQTTAGARCNRHPVTTCQWCGDPADDSCNAYNGYRWHEGCLGDWARYQIAAEDPESIL